MRYVCIMIASEMCIIDVKYRKRDHEQYSLKVKRPVLKDKEKYIALSQLVSTECPKIGIEKNFYSGLFTVLIHRFSIHLDSVYPYVLFGVSFNRFGRIQVKLQQFCRDICVFQEYKFS